MGSPLILVRHGESEFNVVFSKTRIDPGIKDPHLTPAGRQQARLAAAALAGHAIARIVCSPYMRTLQTAQIIAATLNVAIEIEPLVRERGYFACDIGTPASELQQLWPEHDFDHLDEIWWHEDEGEEMVDLRCNRFRARIVDHPDWPNIAVVAHWGFIRTLTGFRLGNGELVTYRLPEPARAFSRR